MGINGLPKMLRDRNTPTDKIRKIKGCTLGIDSSILSAVFLYSNANAVERYHMVPRMPYLTPNGQSNRRKVKQMHFKDINSCLGIKSWQKKMYLLVKMTKKHK